MKILMILMTANLFISMLMLALLGLFSLFRQTLTAQTRYFMWIILLIALVIPFRPALGNGLIKIQNPAYILTQNTPVGVSDDALSNNPVPDKEPVIVPDQKEQTNLATPAPSSAPQNKGLIMTVIFAVWAIGAFLFLAKFVIEYRRFHLIVKRWGKPVTDPFTLETFEWVKARMGLENKNIVLLSVSTISTPMLTGLLKPTILLPEKSIEDDEMELILEHELTHYKHKDLWINLIGVIALCIHWFNPILYLCMPAIYGDGESYCDETVLKNKNLDYRRFYGEVIISMIEASPQKHLALSTCFYAKKLNIKKRLFHIMESHGKRTKLSVFSVALVLCLTIVSGSIIVFGDPNQRSIDIKKDQNNLSENQTTKPDDTPKEITSQTQQQIPEPENKTPENKKISITPEKAKQIALRNAKLTSDEANFVHLQLSADQTVYNAEFHSKNVEYDYKIDARTGAILEQDKEVDSPERLNKPAKNEDKTNSKNETVESSKKTSAEEKISPDSTKNKEHENDEDNKDDKKNKDNDDNKNVDDKDDDDKDDNDNNDDHEQSDNDEKDTDSDND